MNSLEWILAISTPGVNVRFVPRSPSTRREAIPVQFTMPRETPRSGKRVRGFRKPGVPSRGTMGRRRGFREARYASVRSASGAD